LDLCGTQKTKEISRYTKLSIPIESKEGHRLILTLQIYKKSFLSGVPPDEYISFYGMRAHDVLMGLLVSKTKLNCL
jgi:hypothetical protein